MQQSRDRRCAVGATSRPPYPRVRKRGGVVDATIGPHHRGRRAAGRLDDRHGHRHPRRRRALARDTVRQAHSDRGRRDLLREKPPVPDGRRRPQRRQRCVGRRRQERRHPQRVLQAARRETLCRAHRCVHGHGQGVPGSDTKAHHRHDLLGPVPRRKALEQGRHRHRPLVQAHQQRPPAVQDRSNEPAMGATEEAIRSDRRPSRRPRPSPTQTPRHLAGPATQLSGPRGWVKRCCRV